MTQTTCRLQPSLTAGFQVVLSGQFEIVQSDMMAIQSARAGTGPVNDRPAATPFRGQYGELRPVPECFAYLDLNVRNQATFLRLEPPMVH